MKEKKFKNKLLFVFFIFMVFTFIYVISEFSINNSDLLVGYANTDVQECGCSKCHTIELNGCIGCHNSQKDNSKSNNNTLGLGESNEPDTNIDDESIGSQEPEWEIQDSPESNTSVPNNDNNKSNIDTEPNKEKQRESKSEK